MYREGVVLVNQLGNEKSPYLLQHAGNPIDWYSWGDDAFAKAAQDDKPVFLSIGYSTCHWCHVMARESFTDNDVAAILNEHFVSIKVDREERPDVDSFYMAAAQALSGGGGWPLTIIMTPEKKPFYAATYLPKKSQKGLMGLTELLTEVSKLWEKDRDKVDGTAVKLMDLLSAGAAPAQAEPIDSAVLQKGQGQLAQHFDSENGGFGGAPKFPTPQNLIFLLRYWRRTGSEGTLAMVDKTLTVMRQRGLYDHLGFGFHRYSTDASWSVPHYEKMLYDQAMLAMAYTEAYQATGKKLFGDTVRDTFTYALRDLGSPEGGFYSAEDADSQGEEGKFYRWSMANLEDALGSNEADFVRRAFSIGAGDIPAGLQLSTVPGEDEAVDKRLMEVKKVLLKARGERVRPHRDEKILTDWNGLMIAALAKGARALGENQYARDAAVAADFIIDKLVDDQGWLLHRYAGGQAAIGGFLNDYAFFVWGLIELYQADFEPRWLKLALEINSKQTELFWDSAGGGYFDSVDTSDPFLAHRKNSYDGAIPSGNSVSLMNLVRLGRLTGDPSFEARAAETAKIFASQVNEAPLAYAQMLVGLDLLFLGGREVVIVGRRGSDDTRQLVEAAASVYAPEATFLLRNLEIKNDDASRLAPFTKDMSAIDGSAAVYVCRDRACDSPTTSAQDLVAKLRSI